ncbi:hypothetical protein ALC56_15112 [Trachymyrmex septentrionalis]|uniref:Uncharacterized protein n=1 Tax=Trachymyrmex septentrionalis TaxID=34720 RepID=A0A195EQG4_9HYME|nr:hypothetical protein ALC56_15112 [Trachymyrmex septentrionalis]
MCASNLLRDRNQIGVFSFEVRIFVDERASSTFTWSLAIIYACVIDTSIASVEAQWKTRVAKQPGERKVSHICMCRGAYEAVQSSALKRCPDHEARIREDTSK